MASTATAFVLILGQIAAVFTSGGIVTNRSQFAYQVSIRFQNGAYRCGGSLITPRHVLTSARCVVECPTITACNFSPQRFVIVGGDLSLSTATAHTAQRNVSALFAHPDYNPLTMRHDVAILEVDVPFVVNNATLRPVPLSLSSPSADTECVLSGWGVTEQTTPNPSDELLYVDALVVNNDRCRQTQEAGFVFFREDHLCAGYPDEEVGWCEDDMGDALVCAGAQVGVFSFGSQCADAGVPAVYARVAYFAQWIEEVTGLVVL